MVCQVQTPDLFQKRLIASELTYPIQIEDISAKYSQNQSNISGVIYCVCTCLIFCTNCNQSTKRVNCWLSQSRSFSVHCNQSTKRVSCWLSQSCSLSVHCNQSTMRVNCWLSQSHSFSVHCNQSTMRVNCWLSQSRSFSVHCNQSTKRVNFLC